MSSSERCGEIWGWSVIINLRSLLYGSLPAQWLFTLPILTGIHIRLLATSNPSTFPVRCYKWQYLRMDISPRKICQFVGTCASIYWGPILVIRRARPVQRYMASGSPDSAFPLSAPLSLTRIRSENLITDDRRYVAFMRGRASGILKPCSWRQTSRARRLQCPSCVTQFDWMWRNKQNWNEESCSQSSAYQISAKFW